MMLTTALPSDLELKKNVTNKGIQTLILNTRKVKLNFLSYREGGQAFVHLFPLNASKLRTQFPMDNKSINQYHALFCPC